MTTQFIEGKKYSAVIEIPVSKILLASNLIIAEKLEEAGFTSIKVSGTGFKRIAEGTWSNPTEEVDVEKLVSAVVISNITEL